MPPFSSDFLHLQRSYSCNCLIMTDSLLYYLNVLQNSDTINNNFTIADTTIVSQVENLTFLQFDNVDINPTLYFASSNTDVITYILFVLLGVISVIWYFLPEKLSTILSLRLVSKLQRVGDSDTKVIGAFVSSFFWLNFIAALGIFIMLILQLFFEKEIADFSIYSLLSIIYLILLVLILYRYIIIRGSAFLFQTHKLMIEQLEISRNIQFLSGVLLVPIILVILYIGGDFFIYIGIGVIILLQAYRILQLVIIGKSSTIFSTVHIILYLCTLEIVPVLVLVRLIGNGSVI